MNEDIVWPEDPIECKKAMDEEIISIVEKVNKNLEKHGYKTINPKEFLRGFD